MNRVYVIAAAVGMLAACAPSKHSQFLQDEAAKKLACTSSAPPAISKLEPASAVSMEVRSGCSPVERGIHRGMTYMIDHDMRRAEFYSEAPKASWIVICNTDKVTDLKSAQVIRSNFMLFRTSQWEGVSVTANTYPGSPQVIRVDDREARTVNLKGKTVTSASKQVIQDLLNGSEFITRHTEWPSGVAKDASHSAFGFDVAYSYSDRCI